MCGILKKKNPAFLVATKWHLKVSLIWVVLIISKDQPFFNSICTLEFCLV